jgi:hypothetical protein
MGQYQVKCTCGAVQIEMQGDPKVRGFCHCEDCRELLNVPYHSVDAWENEKVKVVSGKEEINIFQHPRLNMKRFSCKNCGEIIFNSNGMDWRVFSQLFIAKSYEGKLPEELNSKSHFFYGRRIIDVNDELPKKE